MPQVLDKLDAVTFDRLLECTHRFAARDTIFDLRGVRFIAASPLAGDAVPRDPSVVAAPRASQGATEQDEQADTGYGCPVVIVHRR
jgi:hypothetical protein